MSVTRRRRLLVDRKLQGALLLNNTLYWFYCLLSVTLIAFCWIIFVQRPSSSGELIRLLVMNHGPALLGFVLLLPLVLMDSLRFSNRFAGAMVRIQREMKKLAQGQIPDAVHIRQGDFWTEFAEDFNRVAVRMQAARQSTASSGEEAIAGCSAAAARLPMGDAAPGTPAGQFSGLSV